MYLLYIRILTSQNNTHMKKGNNIYKYKKKKWRYLYSSELNLAWSYPTSPELQSLKILQHTCLLLMSVSVNQRKIKLYETDLLQKNINENWKCNLDILRRNSFFFQNALTSISNIYNIFIFAFIFFHLIFDFCFHTKCLTYRFNVQFALLNIWVGSVAIVVLEFWILKYDFFSNIYLLFNTKFSHFGFKAKSVNM